MQNINNIVLVGRLTRDMELKYTSGGMAVGNFTLAVNRSVKKAEGYVDEASFFDCTIFGNMAAAMDHRLTKGSKVAINGALRQDRWKDQEGQNRSKVYIVVQELEFASTPNNNTNGQGQNNNYSAPYEYNDGEIAF